MKTAFLSIVVICSVVAVLLFAISAVFLGNTAAATIALVGLYFLPAIVAGARGHHQFAPIAVLNVFLGWTFVGWVVALAMSVSHQGSQS